MKTPISLANTQKRVLLVDLFLCPIVFYAAFGPSGAGAGGDPEQSAYKLVLCV